MIKYNEICLSLLFCSFILFSCQKQKSISTKNDDKYTQSDIKTENRYLVFKDEATYLKTISNLYTKSENYKETFWEKLSFKSANEILDQANGELGEIENINQLNTFLKKYDGILRFAPDSSLELDFGNPLINNVLNKEGLVKVGKALLRYSNGKLISKYNGTKADLLSISLDHPAAYKNMDVLDLQSVASNRIMRGMSPMGVTGCHFTGNEYGNILWKRQEQGKRRLYVSLEEYYTVVPHYGDQSDKLSDIVSGYYTGYSLAVHFSGMKKSIFGWNNYKTTFHVNTLNYDGYAMSLIPPYDQYEIKHIQSNLSDYQVPGEEKDIYMNMVTGWSVPPNDVGTAYGVWMSKTDYQNMVDNNSWPHANIYNFYLSATSRGVSDPAIISCQD